MSATDAISARARRYAGVRPVLLAVSTTLAALSLTISCSHAPLPAPAPAASDERPTGLEPVTTETPPSPEAQRLARKTADYADNVGSRPGLGDAPLGATSPAAPGADGGNLRWADPNAFRLTPLPEPGPNAPPVQPAMDASPRLTPMLRQGTPGNANPLAVPFRRHPTTDPSFPATVPEGQDRLTPAASAGAPQAESSDALEARLAAAVRDYPRDVAGQLDLQLLQFVQGRPTPNMSLISGLPQEDRDIVTTVMDGLNNFRESVRSDNNMLLSRKIQPLLDMADRLHSQAELTIPTIALCTRVDGFGNYTPIDPARFPAGQPAAMVVYCEVQNFASQLNDKQMWETKLTQQAVLYSDTGMQVWPAKENPIAVNDACRNHRHDFYVINVLHMPSDLTIGRYLLKVTISDLEANHVAEATAPLEIVAQ